MDRFYTPDTLASELISHCKLNNPKTIADFAVGAGSLLTAAHKRWPIAEFYGVDIERRAIKQTRNIEPKVAAYQVDFLSEAARKRTSRLVGRIDLVVLNPPFSCMGAAFERVVFGGQEIKCSKAMAFILASCEYLSSNGEILAILPRSCLFSQKDRRAREALLTNHSFVDLGRCHSPGFNGASVSVHLVKVAKKELEGHSIGEMLINRISPERNYDLILMRGAHPVSQGDRKRRAPSLIHTTDLFDGEVSMSRLRATKLERQVSGPVLMLPRVSRPNVSKVAVANFIKPVVASDCIICIKTLPAGSEVHLQDQLTKFWSLVSESYSGTCASYLTLEALSEVLRFLGYRVEVCRDPKIWNPEDSGKSCVRPSRIGNGTRSPL